MLVFELARNPSMHPRTRCTHNVSHFDAISTRRRCCLDYFSRFMALAAAPIPRKALKSILHKTESDCARLVWLGTLLGHSGLSTLLY